MKLLLIVVYRSSETSTNQSDVIIRSDDRFLNLVVDSDSIVSKIYMLNFVLWLVFFFCLHTDKNIAVLSQLLFFLPSYWQTSVNFVQAYFWHSIHIFGLVYYLSTSRNSPFYIKCYTYGKRSFVLFYVTIRQNSVWTMHGRVNRPAQTWPWKFPLQTNIVRQTLFNSDDLFY